MLTREEVELVKIGMRITPAEMPILNAMAGLRMSLDEVREGVLLVRKFRRWHRRNNNPYPLLNEFRPQIAETQWFAIQWWWDEYCDARQKVADPKEDDLFVCFRNYKPDR